MLDDDKRYQVIVQLGIKTNTGDLEGRIIETKAVPEFSVETLQAILDKFTGEIDQVPPMYSALKQNGKKLYELARDGITVERKARRITIFELKLLDAQQDSLGLEVHCSKGTYIRSLAEDIGDELGCGATVKALRRLQAGQFSIGQAMTLEQLQDLDGQALAETLIPVDAPLHTMPAVYLDGQQAASIRFGQTLDLDETLLGSVRIYATTEFLGLGEMRLDGKLAPKKLFNLNG
jgi:tRNA pseudouridine55 synthase